MKNSFTLPLFWKFTIAITTTVAIFGTINFYLVDYAVYDIFKSELSRHGKITATTLAERSIIPIAYGDLGMLDQIVTSQKKIDSSIAYIFIMDKNNKILAHSFDRMVPGELITVNKPSSSHEMNIIKIIQESPPHKTIWDIAVPIMDGNLGTVRLGLFEENYLKSMNKTTRIFIIMVVLFLTVGIIGAFIFSYIITTPLKTMSSISKSLELDSLNVQLQSIENKLNSSEIVKWKNILNIKDEIDSLIVSFGEMVKRLKTTYDELQKTQSSLFQSEKMASLGTLSAGIAHEINNPIAGIQNCVRRLKENPSNLKQNVFYLDMIDESLKKVEKVVKGLLDFSRKPDMKLSPTNICKVIENVLLLASFNLEKSRISIKKEYDSKEILLNASANHLEQVILNLILNSIDAIEERKQSETGLNGEIKISLKEFDNRVVIEISDNGVGVPEEYLNEIFDPFFSRKKNGQGTGLGLAVSYSIVEQHHGRIAAHINEQKGLSVRIELPKNEEK